MVTCTLLLLSLVATGEDAVGWVSDPTEPHAETQMDAAVGSETQPTTRRGPLRRLLDRWRNRPTRIIDRLEKLRDALKSIAVWIVAILVLCGFAAAMANRTN